MNKIAWWLVDILSRTLDPDERDAVRGDLVESGESAGQSLRGLIGLVVRRQVAVWNDWRPWVAPLGLTAPVLSGVLGIGWIGLQFRTIWTYGVRFEAGLPVTDDIVTLVCATLLPIAWAWSGGLVQGVLSRRTAWVWCVGALLAGRLHATLFWLLPGVVLILIPFLCGVYRGIRRGGLGAGRAVWLAAAIAILTLIMQVEDGRSHLAFAAWSSGGALDGRLAWTPSMLPFVAIVWQFGLMSATMRLKENNT
jgi:hypothetical protein